MSPARDGQPRVGHRAAPWRELRRGLLGGVAATAAMTAVTSLVGRLRPRADAPVDYDASRHVVVAVETVLRRPARTRAERRAYFALAHWGYGSAVGCGYAVARRATGSDAAAVAAYFTACQTMAMTLLPVLGGAPPPHRWPRRILLTSLLTHAVYVGVVAATSGRRRVDDERPRGDADLSP